MFSGTAQAATITVVNLNDSGTGSLRQAIADADVGDEIEFAANLAGETIVTSSTLTLPLNVTITGPGTGTERITIDAQDSHRAIEIQSPANVTLLNLIITNGNSGSDNGGGIGNGIGNGGTLRIRDCDITSSSSTSNGGGIYSFSGSTMVMERCLISGNYAGTTGGGIGLNGSSSSFQISDTVITNNTATGDGGGLSASNVGGLVPALFMTACEISSNTAENGGGMRAENTALDMVNCTIAGNNARNNGGGLYSAGYWQYYAFLTLTDNTADSDDTDGGDGGGVYSSNPAACFRHCLIAGNLDNSSTGNQHDDFYGDGQYQGYVIFRDQSGASLSHDADDPSGKYGVIESSSAAPEALADNGGDTKTCALGAEHPALDRAAEATTWDDGTTVDTDQRGTRRPSGVRADIGAYERSVPSGTGPLSIILLN